jgi:hypothetical protein
MWISLSSLTEKLVERLQTEAGSSPTEVSNREENERSSRLSAFHHLKAHRVMRRDRADVRVHAATSELVEVE